MVRLTLLHDLPLVEHYFHPSGRVGLSETPVGTETPGDGSSATRSARLVALGATATVAGLFALDSTVVSVALPEIQEDLGGGSATIEWVASVYLIAYAVSLLPAGRMVDRFGAKRMFVVGVLVYVVAALLAALAAAPWMLILGRGLQGVGAGIVSPAGLLLVTRAFGEERRGRAIGSVGMLLAIFSAVGPLVGGAFTDTVGWRAIFVAHAGLAGFAALLVLGGVSRDRSFSKVALRFGSTAALAVMVLALQVCIIEGRRFGWPVSATFFLVAVASAIVLWRLERGRSDKVLDLSLLRRRPVAASAISRSVVSFAFYGNLFYLTLFLEGTAGYSAFETGLILLPSSLAGVVASPLVGRLVDRIGPNPVMAAGTATVAAGLFAIALIDSGSSVAFHLVPSLLLNGFGYAMVSVAAKTAPLGAVREDEHGRVTSLVSFISRVASGLGVTFATGVFHLASAEGIRHALTDEGVPIAPKAVNFVRGCLGVSDLRSHLHPEDVRNAGLAAIDQTVAIVDDAFAWTFSATSIVLGLTVLVAAAAIGLLLLGDRKRSRQP